MITEPHRDFPVVDSRGIHSQAMEGWVRDITKAVNDLQTAVALLPPLTGTGSPEGVVDAEEGRFYVDTAGPATYQKIGSGNTGWFAV